MPQLSIIVPVYNVELYIRRCLDSILSQTFNDFEAIIIDDGSPDNCWSIIDEYVQRDDRIIAIHQQNKGVSAARNAGLRIAKGEYIGFVDPDDWIEETMYENMIYSLKSGRGDMVFCNWNINQIEDEIVIDHYMPEFPIKMTAEYFFFHLFDSPRTVNGSVWNKVFRKEVIKTFFDESFRVGEDWLFLSRICLEGIAVIFCNETLYHYCTHKDSVMNKNIGDTLDGLIAERSIIDIVAIIGNSCKMHAEKDYLDVCLRYYNALKRETNTKKYYQVRNYMYEYLSNNTISVIRNYYITRRLRIVYIRWLIEEFINHILLV